MQEEKQKIILRWWEVAIWVVLTNIIYYKGLQLLFRTPDYEIFLNYLLYVVVFIGVIAMVWRYRYPVGLKVKMVFLWVGMTLLASLLSFGIILVGLAVIGVK